MDLDLGRTSQKARTRRDLLAAARRVLDRGETFSVNAVADEAAISRATAYRYFSDPDTLMLEAVLDGQFATPEHVVGDIEDVRERVHRVQQYLFQATREAEARFRLFLARALETSVTKDTKAGREVRAGRRLPMYEHALAPVRPFMTDAEFDFLVLSLSAASGLEVYLALKDVCRVDNPLADRIATSNIDAILDKLLPTQQKASSRRKQRRSSAA
jgi:AcrR family transcriptional regulator